ncbi:AI-2E family transporter [bacterium]|nr:MAG: AI-2E family transporter [bacterium]
MKTNYNTYFFFAVLIGLTVLAFFIMKPFLIPFIFALILVHLFNPVYNFLLKKTGRKWLSSLLTCLLIALIIIIPVLIILALVAGEVQSVIVNLAGNPESIKKIINVTHNLSSLPVFKSFDFGKIVNQDSILSALKSFSQGFLFILQGTYAGILRFIFVMIIMFFSLFYMFIDGKKLVDKIMELIPLKEKYDTILIEDINSMIRATLRGTMLMAIFEGILGGVLFWTTGVASPVLFGILMAVFSVIPPMGSGIVWFPVGIAMIFFGHPMEGIIILLAGFLVISTIDILLRPKLIGKDIQMHPLLILFSTLGGIALFGISGFIIGPMIMSLLVVLWDIYVLDYKIQSS